MATLYLDRSASRAQPQFFPEFDSTKRTTTQVFNIGTRALDKDGNEYTYVKFGGTVAATDAVAGGSTTGLSGVVASANTATGAPWIGVGHAAAIANDFGFIQTRGVASVKTGNITAGATVIAKTTAGTLNDAAATDWSNRWGQAVSDDSGGVANVVF